MSEFTPGPWRWGWNGDACVVWGVAIVMSGGDYYPDSAARKAKEANARLIAAAPELYDELKKTADALASVASDLNMARLAMRDDEARRLAGEIVADARKRVSEARAALEKAGASRE